MLPLGQSVMLFVACLFIGTVFVFGGRYWNSDITKEDARNVTAVYESYKISYGRHHHIKEILIRFSDHDQLSIDGSCVTEELIEIVEKIIPGSTVSILVHPNSDTIMQMVVGQTEIIGFEDTMKIIAREREGFKYPGIFMYSGAVMAFISIIVALKDRFDGGIQRK